MKGILNTKYKTVLIELYNEEIIDISIHEEHFSKIMEILQGSCLVKRSGCSTWPALWNVGMFNEEPMHYLTEEEQEYEDKIISKLLKGMKYKP